ncbi:hypothetical protein ACA910_006003 [Epithemia clementina (nom. ined.)]
MSGVAFSHGQVECPGETSPKVIPADKINDGYCDCPQTGADEPETAACSGSYAWGGVLRGGAANPPGSLSLFTCPQQPKVKLALSRLNDGVCDCCDGADESSSSGCKDNCAVVLAEERRLRKELEETYKVGSRIRQKLIADFAVMRKEKLEEAAKLESELKQTEESLHQLEEQYSTLELQWIQQRLTSVDSHLHAIALRSESAEVPISGMLEALTEEELTWWIIHACQISGEMMGDDGSFQNDNNGGNSKSCIPLRMAGLDSQIWWEPKTYQMVSVQNEADNDGLLSALAKLRDYNLKNPNALIWHRHRLPKSPDSQRRLDDIYDEDDFADYHMDDDYIEDDLDDEDINYESERDHRRNSRTKTSDDSVADSETTSEKREEIMAMLKTKSFSVSRVRFLELSSNFLQTIEKLTKEAENEDAEIPDTPEQVEKVDDDAEKSKSDIQFDPMALPMIKNKLQRRMDAIERGFDFAISASVLLDSLHSYSYKDGSDDKKLEDLRRFALGVVNYGKLSSYHVWQLYQAVMAELSGAPSESEEGSCEAPWASSCPPTSAKRSVSSGSEVDVPPKGIIERATAYCDSLMSQFTGEDAICSVPSSSDKIPSEIPDGYFGYYQISARSDDDLMSKVFEKLGLQDDSAQRLKLVEIQEQLKALEEKKRDIQSSMEQAIQSVGGKDEPETLGKEGELFHLKNKCFLHDAASYTYELCLFQTAKQRDSGSSSGGVLLGNWAGQEMEEKSADGQTFSQRVWTWTEGVKCWNGPQRSASAEVKCGRDTKIVGADEPDTCRYVLEVESPIACDEEFRSRHNL